MKKLRLASQWEITVKADGIDKAELRERTQQVKRSMYRTKFASEEQARRALEAAIAADRVAADWCEVEEVAYL
jgi:hypothetical protein